MAKAKKVKDTVTEITEPIVEAPQVETVEEVVEETIPDIVEEPKVAIIEEVKVVEEPIKEVTVVKPEAKEELSMEQRIVDFLESRTGEIRLNEFLKSLFPIPTNGEPSSCLQQGTSRMLRGLLEEMQAKCKIVIVDNKHRLLGQPYYPDSNTGKQAHHNLNTIGLFVKK